MTEANDRDQVDLLNAFMSYNNFQTLMKRMVPTDLDNTKSASVAMITLQGLFCIEDVIQSGQAVFDTDMREMIRRMLRKWRCESPLALAYTHWIKVVPFLRSLTIFKHLGPVVQSMINANPGLNFNLLFWFMYFCSTVCFKT